MSHFFPSLRTSVRHYEGDIRRAPVWAWPVTDIFWASPECTNWSVAKGKRRDFDRAMQGDLLDLYAELEAEKFTSGRDEDPDKARSEEHKSELQSLLRISYAVFCLKKKKHK